MLPLKEKEGVFPLIGKLTDTEEINIPCNIRQIGQIQDGYKIYMEDYVSTYLNRISNHTREKSRSVLLLGTVEERHDGTYFFVRGAACSEGEYETMKENCLNDEEKEHFERVKEEYFNDQQVIGWGIVKGELGRLTEEYIDETILKDRDWAGRLFLEMDRFNCVDRFYICGEVSRRACSGYYIYYDRNDPMQRLLSEWEPEQYGKEVSVGGNAAPREWSTGQFRSALHKSAEQDKKNSGSYALGMVAVIAVLVMAIVSINNYERLNGMEDTIDQVALFIDDKIQSAGESIHVSGSDAQDSLRVETEDVSDIGYRMDAQTGDQTNPWETPGADRVSADGQAATGQQEGMTGQGTTETDQAIRPEEQRTGDRDAGGAGSDAASGSQGTAETDQASHTGNQGTGEDVQASNTGKQSTDEIGTANMEDKPQQVDIENISESVETGGGSKALTYIIQSGDTLVGLSRRYYGDETHVQMICDYNHIENGDKIYIGQKILLP